MNEPTSRVTGYSQITLSPVTRYSIIAVELMADSSIVFVDEPTSVE